MELNVQQEARVWSRVLGGDGLTAEQLLALIREEEQTACTYGHLAGLICPRERQTLKKLAGEERCHADRLRAVYFLMTGQRVCAQRQEPPCVTCLSETLRQQYKRELADAERYAGLAKGEFACTMEVLAREEKAHAQALLCLLQRVL